MKECFPCHKSFMTWTAFGRHMHQVHGINRDAFWRRANQVGDAPCIAVRADSGGFFLMVQGVLM